jgi:hypothetical protein
VFAKRRDAPRRLRLATELIELREAAELTHGELAARISENQAKISRLENGHIPHQAAGLPAAGRTDHRLAAVPGPVSGAGPAESSAVCQRAAVMPGSSDGRAMSCSSRAGAFPSSRSYADRSTVSAPVCLQAAQDDDVAAGGVLDVQGPDVGFGLGLAGEVEPVGAQVFAVLGASWSGEPPEWAAEEARR